MSVIAALPPGFTLDDGSSMPALPDGFTIDPPHPVAGPSGDTLTDAGRRIGTAAATAGAALLSTPRAAAQGVDWLAGKVGLNPGADAALAGMRDPTDATKPAFPDFQTARNMAFNTTGGTEYQPETYLGRRGQDALTGAMMALTGNARAIPAMAGGSATAGAAAEAFPAHPLLAALLGFIPGAHMGNLATTAPQRMASLLQAPNAEPYAAFSRLNLPTEMAGTTTGEPGLVYAEKLAARMPGSEGAVGAARDRLVTGWQDNLDDLTKSLGSATAPQELGTSLQSAAADWLSRFKTNSSQAWNDFYAKVPQDTPVKVGGYQDALKNVLGTFPDAAATGGVLRPGTVQKLSDALGVDLGKAGDSLPWEAVKNIRTSIGEKLQNPLTVADTSQGALKQLYAGLTRDMEAGADGASPDALTAFHKANSMTAAGHDLLETHLDPILTASTPEQAAQYAMAQARTGGSRIGALTFNLPGAAGDMAAVALRNAAKAGGGPVGALVPDVGGGSPSALANALLGRRQMLSPEAQNVLFPDAGTQQRIADLAATGRAMQPLERDLANSPTATHQSRGPARIISAVELARQGHELAGAPGSIAGGMLGLFAPNIAGRVAQATALNPYLSALYGRNIAFQPQLPSALARTLIAPAVAPQLGAPGLPAGVPVPATSANSLLR